MSTAYSVYINDRVIASAGVVSEDVGKIEGSYQRQVVSYRQPVSRYYIIVQVANAEYARGGFWYSLYVGQGSVIQGFHERRIVADGMLMGALLMMAIYHLYIFGNRKYAMTALYMFLVFAFGFLRAGVTGENILYTLVRNADYLKLVRVEYITIIFGPFFFTKFIEAFYKDLKVKIISQIMWGIVTLEVGIVIFANIYTVTSFVYLLEVVAVLIFAYGLFMVIRGVLKHRTNSTRILQSIILFGATFIIDSLFHANIITIVDLPLMTIFGFYIAYVQSVALANENRLNDQIAKELLDTKINFLQAQIRPHFVQNTLNSTIALIESNPRLAEDVLLDFSDYLRNSMNYVNNQREVSIEEELEHIDRYVNIEKIRYQDRFNVQVYYDGHNFMLQPLLIQPLIENAIKYNVERYKRKIVIILDIKQVGNYHHIQVSDNGSGFEVAKKEYGIGLKNTIERLRNQYDETLYIKSDKENGTVIDFKVPRK